MTGALHDMRVATGLSVALLLLGVVAAGPALAQIQRGTPDEVEGIEIVARLGEELPLDLRFTDEKGQDVQLAGYFDGKRPVVLSMGYYRCPMLCDLVWSGILQSLSEISLDPGEDYQLVTVTIDPNETATLARQKKADYLESFGRPGAEDSWHFLTGSEDAIKELAKAVGFGYRYLPERDEYAHAAGMMVVSPNGKLTRYLYGVMYEPDTVRMALLEAGEGKIGSALDRVVMYCFHYNPEEGKYTVAAMNMMRLVGLLTVAALGSLIVVLWRRERRRVGA
jgi:protein SCO1